MSPKKKQFRTICGFCGQPGSSKAHVIAQMLHPYLGEFPTRRSFGTAIEYSSARNAYLQGPVSCSYDHSRPLLDTATKAICRTCNSGWMNEIETAARDPLLRLVAAATLGRDTTVSAAEAEAVSKWAVMTSWSLEMSRAERGNVREVTSSEVRSELYTTRAVPSMARVALGQSRYDNVVHYQVSVGYDLGCEQHPEHRMLVTMIQLKRLVLYIATFDHAEHLRPQPADDCWNTIWPSPRLVTQFPPRRLLSASDLEWALKDFRGWLNVPRGPVIPAG